MNRRRGLYRFDWSDNRRDCWLVRWDQWGSAVKVTRLPAGSDFRVAFLEEAIAALREGWIVADLATNDGWFIARRPPPSKEHIQVSIRNEPPGRTTPRQ
jgi:hypothetical protein